MEEVGFFFLLAMAIVVGGVAITAIVAAIYERGLHHGRREVQQQAVDNDYGRWEVYQGENTFRWTYRRLQSAR